MFANSCMLFFNILHFCVTFIHDQPARSKCLYKHCKQLRFIQWSPRNITRLFPAFQTVSFNAILIMCLELRFKWATRYDAQDINTLHFLKYLPITIYCIQIHCNTYRFLHFSSVKTKIFEDQSHEMHNDVCALWHNDNVSHHHSDG